MGWNEIGGSSGSDKKETNFVKLTEGTHTIRLVDDAPKSRWSHWLTQANAGKGLTVTCIGKGCPVCTEIREDKKNNVKKPRYTSRKMHSINVLNRTLGEVQILDKGNGLFEQILGVKEEMEEDNGAITNYDLKIRVNGSGKDVKYVVLPGTPKVLTEAEQALIKEKYDLAEIFPVLETEQITALMNGATFDEVFENEDTSEKADDDVDFNDED